MELKKFTCIAAGYMGVIVFNVIPTAGSHVHERYIGKAAGILCT
jgi:hypothetical protein